MTTPVTIAPPTQPGPLESAVRIIALVGNPNTGKTTLFNRLSGLRHKTSNFPGTTLEARVTRVRAGIEGGRDGDLIDLPGIYSLELDQLESRVCREVLAGQLAPRGEPIGVPEVVCIVVDATNLARNLMLVGEVCRRRLPTVVVLNMIDLARRQAVGAGIDPVGLAAALGCPVVCASARSGEGVDDVRRAIRSARIPAPVVPVPGTSEQASGAPAGAPHTLRDWAELMFERAAGGGGVGTCIQCGYDLKGLSGEGKCPECGRPHSFTPSLREGAGGRAIPQGGSLRGEPQADTANAASTTTDRLDRAFTHPVLGLLAFCAVMTAVFYTLFTLATIPMDWIDWFFGIVTARLHDWLPSGVLTDLLADGVVQGIGATVIFLPQICLLFFLISLLEDTGYLARAAFVMNRLLAPFGLSGHSFVPLLSSHACALPGIMATRSIPDRRERLATILVAPFVTCSARLPVYVLLTSLLFAGRPFMAALAFVGCYALGIFAAVFSALIARRTILRGAARPMVLELPTYKWPSVRTALITTYDRGMVFLKNAGTNILMICICLWWLSSYPSNGAAERMEAVTADAALVEAEIAKIVSEMPEIKHTFEERREWPAGEKLASEVRSRLATLEREKLSDPKFLHTLRSPPMVNWMSSHPPIDTPSDVLAFAKMDVYSELALARHMIREQAANSFAGRLGKFIQPVFEPLGYDWQLSIGVLTSFAAREVFVSTLAVVVAGQEDTEDEGVFEQIKTAKRDDGVTPIFTTATCWSLLVYYVLAMQCLPTLAVTARESGSWKWAMLQLAWMCGVAYVAAAVVYQVAK